MGQGMKTAEVHRCEGCGLEARSEPDGLPADWQRFKVIALDIELCARCIKASATGDTEHRIRYSLREILSEPTVGDQVELRVDGLRGKFAGYVGVVESHGPYRGQYMIRVPGKRAPGEEEEYVGPYSRDQFLLKLKSSSI